MLGEVPGLLYLTLFLLCYAIASADTPRKYSWLILGGAFAGLCIVTKPLFLVLAPAIVVGVFLSWRRGHFSLFEIGMAAVMAVLPIGVWLLIQFQSGDSLSQILTYYANPYEIPNLGEVIITNLGKMFTDVGALYLTITMLVWIAAVAVRLYRKEQVRSEETMALIFCLLVIAAFLRTAGWYRYLFPAQAVALIFLPAALSTVWNSVSGLLKFDGFWAKRLLPITVGILAAFGIYQLSFDSWVADSYSGKRTADWQEFFSGVSSTTSLFFYNTPELAIYAPHRNYYQYLVFAGGSIGYEQIPVVVLGYVDRVILETDMYQPLSEAVFGKYELEGIQEKYSILRLR